MAEYLLALDQGTSSSRAFLFDRRARLLAARQIAVPVHFQRPGWVEQDPLEIWRTQRDAARAVLRDACTADDRILGIGISNQRETTVVWDRATLEPVGPAIGWQCRRTATVCRTLHASHGDAIRRITGLRADPYFSGPKIAWLLDATAGTRERAVAGDLAAGTIDSWLLAKLTNGAAHLTDETNASRTLCYDIHTHGWNPSLCAAQEVPLSVLPEVTPSLGEFGVAAGEHLGREIPILAVAGDQQAALFGQACHQPGPAKVTYGTGAFLLAHTGGAAVGPVPGLLTTIAAGDGTPAYALEGSVLSAGAVVQWLRDELHLIRASHEIEALAASAPDSGEVSLVPAFTGLGAPHWVPAARGLIAGLSRGTSAAQLARAALEAIAFRVREVVSALDAARDAAVDELRAGGDAARNDLLLQIQADTLQRPVVRPSEPETTALGAALMAGVVAGVWPSVTATSDAWHPAKRFLPAGDLEATYNRWRRARDAAISLARDA
ncbi:MAG: glycerol kinase GlpK [Dehalococcoidia bacterium]